MIPVVTHAPQEIDDDAKTWIEQEKPQDTRDGRCNGVRPDQKGFVGHRSMDDTVGLDRQK